MLTDNEIEEYMQSVNDHMITPTDTFIDMSINTNNVNILFSRGRLLAVANYFASVKAFAEFDASFSFSYSLKSMKHRQFTVFSKNRCWRLNIGSEGLWEDNPKIESLEELKALVLLNQKVALLDKIHKQLDISRKKATRGAAGQHNIYFAKYLEAREILDKGITDDDTLRYPFTSGYADTLGIGLVEAARRIMLQYETQSAFLAENENMRMRYTTAIKNETDIANLSAISANFLNEIGRIGAWM